MMLVIYVSGLSTGFAQEFQAEKSGSRIRLEMYLEKYILITHCKHCFADNGEVRRIVLGRKRSKDTC